MNNKINAIATRVKTKPPLLEHYNPGTCIYFSSPHYSLLAKPPFANLLDAGMSDLAQRVAESLRLAQDLGHKESIVIGAINFDVTKKSYLRLSTNFERSAAFSPEHLLSASDDVVLGHYTIQAEPKPDQFLASVKEALERFDNSELQKVVLSRTLKITCEKAPDVKALVKKLADKNAAGYTFAVALLDQTDDDQDNLRTLIGASPELLISRRGNKIIANPLAGSEPRHKNPEQDKALARQLMQSPKDRHEHALVVQEVAKVLRLFCSEIHVPTEPELMNTATMWHLSTRIEGELKNHQTSSIELALALHPTPAVCGYPMQTAREAIAEIEPYDRGLFTGMVGWCDSSGDGEWIVTIRCAEVAQHTIRLYAGAGVVPGSTPEKELAETGAKFNTILNALGICEGV